MLAFDNVTKLYQRRGPATAGLRLATRALDGLSISVQAGEFVAVVGPSGSGKSTLLHLAACLDVPTSGEVVVDNVQINQASETERTHLRRYRIGLVFQFFNLLPTLTIERNIALPLLLDGKSMVTVRPKVCALLDRIGLADRAESYPDELSGGQMQRVAIARALVTDPALLLADEPTGNLDSATSQQIMALVRETAGENHRTTLLVTHDVAIANHADRIIHLRDGRVERDEPRAGRDKEDRTS